MPDEFNSWETSSGMLEGYDSIKVQEASFGYDPENTRNPEALFLFLDILTDDPENGEGGVVRERYGLGQGWATPDRGATAVHDTNKPRKFNNNSGIGLLIDSLTAAIGLDEAIKLGPTTDADTWRKLGAFKWHRKEFSMKPADGGEEVKYSRMLIVEAIGAGGASASSTPAATAADASAAIDAAAAAPTASGVDWGDGLSPVLKVKLKKFAVESDTHDAFAEKAFALEGVADVAAMEEKVAEEGFYLWLKALG